MNSESSSVRKSRHAAPPELDRLELSIRRLLEAHDAWKQRARVAEARVAELESTMTSLSTGGLDPLALSEQVRALQERNRQLQSRVERGGDAVQKMLARLQFVEEGR
jgi:hypothetical protein